MVRVSFVIASCFTVASLVAQSVPSSAVPPDPDLARVPDSDRGLALARHADRYDSGWIDSYNRGVMTLFDADGNSVRRVISQLILEGEAGDKSIVRFSSPAEIKGVAALTHEHPDATDDVWLYLPASRRVRRISGANRTASFQGTEFTFEDLSNLIVSKYEWRLVEPAEPADEAPSAYVLEAVPDYRDTGYSRLLVTYSTSGWRRERIEFYDKAGRLLKVLVMSDWRQLHGRYWRPHRLEMNNVQTKKRTVIEIQHQMLDLGRYRTRSGEPRRNLTDRDFTTRALSRT